MKRISKKRRSLDGKKILIFAAIAAITIAIIVIASVDAFSMLVPDNEENGNSASNIANGGMAVLDEKSGTVYYSNNGIYAKPKDGEAYEVIEDRAQSLAYQDGVIYFCNMSDNNRCYSFDVETGEKRRLNQDISVEFINVEGENIYFSCVKEIDKRGIYKMDLDGGNLTQISEVYADQLILYKDYFYFINKQDGNTLYRMNLGGKEVLRLTDSYTYCPVVSTADNRIYYSDKDAVYSCNLDGKYTKLIFNGNARSIAITSQGDILIGEYDYTGASESTGIYRLTQEEKIKIRDDEAMWLAVCNDQIYFKSMTRGMEIMRCDINGENGVYVAGNEGSTMLS